MASIAPLAEQMGTILAKCTPEQITAIFDALSKMPAAPNPAAVAVKPNQSKNGQEDKVLESRRQTNLHNPSAHSTIATVRLHCSNSSSEFLDGLQK